MKKVILIIVALVMVLSGVAAVSAYEAHMVNVHAHVENALSVTGPVATEGGEWVGKTVFPEEWLTATITIDLSSSFRGQSPVRVNCVDYNLYAMRKPTGEAWLGDAIYLIDNPAAGWDVTSGASIIGNDPGAGGVVGPIFAASDVQICIADSANTLGVGLDVPVFAGFYNPDTDVKPKPSGLNAPTLVIQEGDARYAPVAGFDGGVELKIQVRNIYKAT